MKNYELTLPQGYEPIFVVDAKNKRTGIVMNIVCFIVVLATLVVAWLVLKQDVLQSVEKMSRTDFSLRWVAFVVLFIAYILLHELTHGVVYKAMTKQKLTFGLTLTVAYCGVPNIYVYRKTSLCALLAPFVVFLPIFLVAIFLLPNALDKMIACFMLGNHVGGCCGDLYGTWLFLTKFTDSTVLMQDTGPKQTFFAKVEQQD